LGEVPRFLNEGLSDYFYSELMEVDEFELWSRIEFVQNLLRERKINQIRIFADVPEEIKIKILKLGSQNALRWMTWEETNQSLVWSLNLENKVMLFLFISMSFLVAISITSGLLIFYSKISRDLMSFWILGMAQEKLIFLCFRFTLILSGLTCFIGTLSGMAGLKILDKFGHEIMPDIFIERKIPIQLNFSEIGLSFSIPFLIAALFSYFSFSHFRKENQSFVSLVRSVS
jgi:lipoprotein-releasing system permease protein